MAVIVETGAIIANANSYLSIADADAWHKLRGNTSWDDLDVEDKEIYLVRAADYLMRRYRSAWKGMRVHSGQALDWPRSGACLDDTPYGYIDTTTIPQEVRDAQAELALKAADGAPLMPDIEPRVLREQVGNLAVEYDRSSFLSTQYAAIDAILAPLLTMGGASHMLMRT